jgi:hypothetical protein
MLRAGPVDARAWLWLSGAVNEPAEQRYCLERALSFDPNLTPAQRGLTALAAVVARAPVEFADPDSDAVGSPSPALGEESEVRAGATSELDLMRIEQGDQGGGGQHAFMLSPSVALSVQPSTAIWTRPWAAFEAALAERNPWETGFLGGLAGVAVFLAWAAQRNLGDQARPVEIIGLAVLIGPLIGLGTLVLGGVLLRSSGRRLGGRGSAGDVRTALAWAGTPLLLGIFFWLVQLILLPKASFSSAQVGPIAVFVAMILNAVHIGLGVWAAGLSLIGLAVAHRFSVLRAAWSWAIAGLMIVGITLAVGFSIAALISLRGG